jgi:hypothetical protein
MQDGQFQDSGAAGIARQCQSLEARKLRVASAESASSSCCDELQETETWMLWPLDRNVSSECRCRNSSQPETFIYISTLLLAIYRRCCSPIKHSFRIYRFAQLSISRQHVSNHYTPLTTKPLFCAAELETPAWCEPFVLRTKALRV